MCFRKICCHVFKGEMFYRFLKMILQSIEIFYLSQKKKKKKKYIYIYIYISFTSLTTFNILNANKPLKMEKYFLENIFKTNKV